MAQATRADQPAADARTKQQVKQALRRLYEIAQERDDRLGRLRALLIRGGVPEAKVLTYGTVEELAHNLFDIPWDDLQPGRITYDEIESRAVGFLADRTPEAPASVESTDCLNENSLNNESVALGVLTQHPDWSIKKIAKYVGVHRGTPNRWPRFTQAREHLEGGRDSIRRGTSTADGAGGFDVDGVVEPVEPQD